MKARTVWMIALLHCCMLNLCAADDVDAIKEKINAIKTDPAFIGAESTQSDEGEAYFEAVRQVQYYYNQRQSEQKQDTLSFNEIHSCIRSLSHPRGERVRVFAYVNIQEVGQILSAIAKENATTPIPEVEHWKSTEKEAISAVQNHVITSDIEIGSQKPLNTKIEPVSSPPMPIALQTSSGIVDVIISLQHIEMIEDARLVLQQFQKEGKIVELEKLSSRSDLKDGRYLVMYDKNGAIRALLEVQQDSFRNIKTNQIETSQQYKGCSAYWFR